MKEIEDSFIGEDRSIRDAIETIERSKAKIALVVGEDRRLLGTVTDGDVRRAVLKGAGLDDSISGVMNKDPKVAHIGDDREPYLELMRANVCRHVPIVDEQGRVVSIETLEETLETPARENWVLIMAGGEGKRLRPLTEDCPKPMLMVGDRPILEMIIRNFHRQGFHKFYISVNYLGHMIQDHFGDGSELGVTIRYIEEDHQLGTAGPLSLLPEQPEIPMIVINGDILTKVDFSHLLDFHTDHEAMATMCVREYMVEVPFGVVELDHHRIAEIMEKPIHKFLINAGIYVLGPSAMEFVNKNEPLDMPVLFERMLAAKHETSVFPIREYWMDIGRIDDFQKANDEYAEEFFSFAGMKKITE